MKVLAFDTSSQATSAAILEDGKFLGEVTLNSSVNHSVTLMPTIDYLLAQTGLNPQEIDRIVVSQGPGSYTGIRIAVTCAKTLAYTLGCELVGLSSLQAIAGRQKSETAIVIPILNARRGMVYTAAYQNSKILVEAEHIALSDFLEQWRKNKRALIFTGEVAVFEEEIRKKFPEAKIVKEDPEKLPSAYELAKLAETQGLEPVSDIHNFNPLYLKKVEAEEKWEAENGSSSEDQELVSRT